MPTPKTFRTADGKTYSLKYDLPTVRNVRDAIEIDLLTGDGIRRVCGSVIDFALVLYESVRDQVEANGLDRDAFLVSLEGHDAEAVDAWLGAVSDFFRRVGRVALARLAESLVSVERETQAMANDLVDEKTAGRIVRRAMTAEGSRRRREIDRLLGRNAGDEATPTPG